MEFEKCKLRDIADVMISGVDKKSNNDETPVRLCNFVDVYRNWAITSSLHDTFMQATAKQIEIDRFLLHKGQVAITKDSETRNDIGIATYIADDFDDVILGYHCALITPNNELVDSKYLNAFLHSNYILRYFELNATGSGMRYTLSNDTILNMPILLPAIEQQKAIGRVFSNIDKQIETLNSINRNLEQFARQLYDYWFVQLDFPNSEGKPYKSSGGEMVWNEKLKRSIPKDWKVVALDSLIDDSRGISYNGSMILGSGIPMINLASFNIDGTYKHSGLKYFNGVYSSNKVLKPFDLVMCNTQQTAIDEKKDIIGKAFLIPALFESDVVSSHHVTTIICKSEEIKPFLAYLFNTRHFHKYAAGCCSGTNIMGLDMKNLKKYELEIPSKELLKRFSRLIIDIESQKSINVKKVLCFKKIRDELLPMLLNGQVNCDLSQ